MKEYYIRLQKTCIKSINFRYMELRPYNTTSTSKLLDFNNVTYLLIILIIIYFIMNQINRI